MKKFLFFLVLISLFFLSSCTSVKYPSLPNGENFKQFKTSQSKEISLEKKRVIFFILQNITEVNRHRMRGETKNTLYTSKNGAELVFDAEGALVTPGFNSGSYNYFNPAKDPLLHFQKDSLPHLLWGNVRDDPTTVLERTFYFYLDLNEAMQLYIFEQEKFISLEMPDEFSSDQEKVFRYFDYILFNPSYEVSLLNNDDLQNLRDNSDIRHGYFNDVKTTLGVADFVEVKK